MEKEIGRRKFLAKGSKLISGGIVGATIIGVGANLSMASSERGNFVTSVDSKNVCATCAYWGGKRKISKDGKNVLSQSLGSCNNPKSPNYQKTTTPETGPMKVWKKWGAL